MKVHIINLPHRTDRLAYVSNVCEREGLEPSIHEATNGQKKYFNEFGNKKMRGHAGCYDSHVTLLEKIKGTEDYHIILEDDVELALGFKRKVEYCVNEHFDMLYLGGNINMYNNATEPFNNNLDVAKKVMATHAYIVKDAAIDAILDIIKKRIYKIDILLLNVQQQMNVLITKECLAWQRQTLSDIIFKVQDTKTKY